MRHKMFTNHYSQAEMRLLRRGEKKVSTAGAISAQAFCQTILLKSGMTFEAAVKSTANKSVLSQEKLNIGKKKGAENFSIKPKIIPQVPRKAHNLKC